MSDTLATTSPTALVPFEAPPTDAIITALVRAHGSVSLAADYLSIPYESLVGLLPALPIDTLVAALKIARLLQGFDMVFTTQKMVMASLADMDDTPRAKLLIEYMDRFEVMLNPPVQGGSGQAGGTNVQVNLLNNVEDARGKLLDSIVRAGRERPDGTHPNPESSIDSTLALEESAPRTAPTGDRPAPSRDYSGPDL